MQERIKKDQVYKHEWNTPSMPAVEAWLEFDVSNNDVFKKRNMSKHVSTCQCQFDIPGAVRPQVTCSKVIVSNDCCLSGLPSPWSVRPSAQSEWRISPLPLWATLLPDRLSRILAVVVHEAKMIKRCSFCFISESLSG